MLAGQHVYPITYRRTHRDTLFYRQLMPNKNTNVLSHVGTAYNAQCWNKKLNVVPIHCNHYHKLHRQRTCKIIPK